MVDINWSNLDKTKLFYGIIFWSVGYSTVLNPWHMILLYKRLNNENISSKECYNMIKTNIGYKGFFRGYPISAIGSIVTELEFMASYECLKENSKNEFMSGTIAHTLILPTTNLVSLIATKQMASGLNSNMVYMSAWETTKYMYKHDGFFGLFKGCGLSMIYMPIYGIWWVIYETSKKYLHKNVPKYNSSITNGVCGGFAGVTTSILLNPLDVVHTKYQATNKKKLKKLILNMYKTNGVKWFYRGFVLNATERSCENALFAVLYDGVKSYAVK